MRSTLNIGFLALTSFVIVDAAVHSVDVGKGGLKFTPNSIAAAVGDTVEFHYYPQKHNVVQGSFDAPCKVGTATTGFYSGFFPVTTGESTNVFRVTVNSTDPMYFYCSQVSHCQNGMVGAINPPSSGNTVDAYSTAAGKTSDSETPANVQGGIVAASSGDDDDDDSSSSSSASGSATSAAASTSSHASSASSAAVSSASSVASSASSATSHAASSVSSAVSSKTSAAASATSSTVTTPNGAAPLGRISYEMLGLAGVAAGVAVMMQ